MYSLTHTHRHLPPGPPSHVSPATGPSVSARAQHVILLPPYKRGCHVITARIAAAMPELAEFEVGLANLFRESG